MADADNTPRLTLKWLALALAWLCERVAAGAIHLGRKLARAAL